MKQSSRFGILDACIALIAGILYIPLVLPVPQSTRSNLSEKIHSEPFESTSSRRVPHDPEAPLEQRIRVTILQIQTEDEDYAYSSVVGLTRLLMGRIFYESGTPDWEIVLRKEFGDQIVLFVRADYERSASRYYSVVLHEDEKYWYFDDLYRTKDDMVFQLCPTDGLEIGPLLVSLQREISRTGSDRVSGLAGSVRLACGATFSDLGDVEYLLAQAGSLGYLLEAYFSDNKVEICGWPEFYIGERSPTIFVDGDGNCYGRDNGGIPISGVPSHAELQREWHLIPNRGN